MTAADRYRAECYLVGTGEKLYTGDAHGTMVWWALDRCNIEERPTSWRIYGEVAAFTPPRD